MGWLDGHMRDFLNGSASVDPPENVLNFRRDANAPSTSGAAAALDLVSQLAEAVKSIRDRANESELWAKSLAEKAIEKLELADARIQSAEAARQKAEEDLQAVKARLEESETELIRAASRIATAEAQAASANDRAIAIERRAIDAEKAFKQVAEAIRAQLIGLNNNIIKCRASAA